MLILKIMVPCFILILNFMEFLHLHFKDHSFILVDTFM